MKRLLVMGLSAVALAAPLMAGAQVSVNVNVPGLITVAPPAPRFERAPPPRGGQAWVPGRWEWRGGAYVWRAGFWQQARPGYDYAPGRWMQADGGWRWVDGDWKAARKAERRYEKEMRRRYHDDDRYHDDGRRGWHCPPGQAKKGNC